MAWISSSVGGSGGGLGGGFGRGGGPGVGGGRRRGGAAVAGTQRLGADADVLDRTGAAAERGQTLLLEERVPFVRELAALVARSPSGQAAAWPVVETVQTDGVCTEVIAPAPGLAEDAAVAATEVALEIAAALAVTGVLAVELFETTDERLLVNELAMRPHNSGHWSQDGAVTGQFEQHVRAVLDLPLGDTAPRAPWSTMINILGGPATDSLQSRFAAVLAEHPAVKVHTYGKAPRPGRKVGHVNAWGEDLDSVVYEARAAAAFFED